MNTQLEDLRVQGMDTHNANYCLERYFINRISDRQYVKTMVEVNEWVNSRYEVGTYEVYTKTLLPDKPVLMIWRGHI